MEDITHKSDSSDYLQHFIPPKYRIDRVSKISGSDFIKNFYEARKPLIMTNMMEDWPALEKWTLEYLKDEVGKSKHTFQFEGKTITMNVADYLNKASDYMENGSESAGFPKLPSKWEKLPYIRHFGPLNKKSQKLNSDIKTKCMFPNDDYNTIDYMFIGLPGTKTEIHYDGSHNFVSVVKGQKHIALLPPGDHPEMFEGANEDQLSVWKRNTVFPMLDPENLCLDLKKLAETVGADPKDPSTYKVPEGTLLMHEHPLLSKTRGLQYSPVHEGEIVFFPATFFHYIHNVDLSVSVTTQSLQNRI